MIELIWPWHEIQMFTRNFVPELPLPEKKKNFGLKESHIFFFFFNFVAFEISFIFLNFTFSL